MSMPAFARRVMELEKKVKVFEAYRYMRIGGVVDVTAPDLPLENCMWADGSLALFDLWPELKAKYENGGFSGLLLPCDCSDEDKTTYPLKWVPDSPNPTGLFVPRLIGLFARYCAGGKAGKYGADTGRGYDGWVSSIAGELDTGLHIEGDLTPVKSNFRQAVEQTTISNTSDGFRVNLSSAWGLTHTGSEFAPAHYHQPIALYLGRSAEI